MTRGVYVPDERGNTYYNPYGANGEEVSSTFEGRHITLQEYWLLHRDLLGNGLVQKGQPVSMYDSAVGVALKTATSQTDPIPIDTEGIWRLEVWAQDDITPGEVMWICDDGAGTDGIVTDDPMVSSGLPAILGYALEPYTFDAQGPAFQPVTMAVKVHWMSWWWFFDGM